MLTWWIGEDDIDLGPTLEGLSAFGEMARAVGKRDREFANLFSIPTRNEEPADDDEAERIIQQAEALRDEFGEELSEHANWVLDRIIGGDD